MLVVSVLVIDTFWAAIARKPYTWPLVIAGRVKFTAAVAPVLSNRVPVSPTTTW